EAALELEDCLEAATQVLGAGHAPARAGFVTACELKQRLAAVCRLDIARVHDAGVHDAVERDAALCVSHTRERTQCREGNESFFHVKISKSSDLLWTPKNLSLWPKPFHGAGRKGIRGSGSGHSAVANWRQSCHSL